MCIFSHNPVFEHMKLLRRRKESDVITVFNKQCGLKDKKTVENKTLFLVETKESSNSHYSTIC